MKHLKLFKQIFCKSRKNQTNRKELLEKCLECINNNNMGYDKKKVANYIIGIIVEYLNYNEAVEAITKSNGVIDNSHIGIIYNCIEKYYDTKANKRNEEKLINVNCIPILLNPWRKDRIIDNIDYFSNKDSFDGVSHSSNILNYHLFPMNFIVCYGGNHSQFAARYKNNGKTIITSSYDYTNIYNTTRFDGYNYINTENNASIKLTDNEGHNITDNEELIFFSGLLFELGRYNLD